MTQPRSKLRTVVMGAGSFLLLAIGIAAQGSRYRGVTAIYVLVASFAIPLLIEKIWDAKTDGEKS